MKKVIIIILVLFIISLTGCSELTPDANTLAPVHFDSIDEILAEIEIRNAPSYDELDSQNLKDIDTYYQLADIPDDMKFSHFSVAPAYIAAVCN